MEDVNKKHKGGESSANKSAENKEHSAPAKGLQQEDNDFDIDEDDLLDETLAVDAPFSATEIPEDLGLGVLAKEQQEREVAVSFSEDNGKMVVEAEYMVDPENTLEHPSQALGSFLDRALKGLKEAQGIEEGEGDGRKSASEGFTTPAAVATIEAQSTPLRRSKRRAASVDEDSIDRAARLVAKRNLEADEGHLQRDTLDPVLDFVAKGGRATASYFGVSCA
ncbi:unnamed protein product [Urochloa decumbens]|uniref:Uncharacterized protein n=1 Tax=Urochloa decumbens TaxID=240449 RepID=A0ABC9AT84_9POAL